MTDCIYIKDRDDPGAPLSYLMPLSSFLTELKGIILRDLSPDNPFIEHSRGEKIRQDVSDYIDKTRTAIEPERESMITYKITKASDSKEEPIEDILISISGDSSILKELASLDDLKLFYENQATMIADALFKSLPQGTLDRLHAAIILRMASNYSGLIGAK